MNRSEQIRAAEALERECLREADRAETSADFLAWLDLARQCVVLAAELEAPHRPGPHG